MVAMKVVPEMKLIIKRTFLEFVDQDPIGSPRPRSFTHSGVLLTRACEEQAKPDGGPVESVEVDELSEDSTSAVNASATEDLKAFLGMGMGAEQDLPAPPPPPKLPDNPRSNKATAALPYEQASDAGSHNAYAPSTQCSMTAVWTPITYNAVPVQQMGNMLSPPMDCYMNPMWQNTSTTSSASAQYTPDCRVASNTSSAEETQWSTVIMRNIPNNYTREMLLGLLDTEGFAQRYDFVYIPIDFSSQAGLGYAFVNLATPSDALTFWAHFEGFRNWAVPSEKVCTLQWSSPIQGLEAHLERYRNSPVMHETVPDQWKPVLYYRGVRMIFPAPTKSIKAPKIRSQKASGTA
jgi:hypothetical protein